MINTETEQSIIYCDGCQMELCCGQTTADAEDNFPANCWIVITPAGYPNEHYCAECHYLDELGFTFTRDNR